VNQQWGAKPSYVLEKALLEPVGRWLYPTKLIKFLGGMGPFHRTLKAGMTGPYFCL